MRRLQWERMGSTRSPGRVAGPPALRARACRSGLLNWFYRQRIAQVHMPITGEFGQDDGSRWEGVRFTDIEIQDAAEYLSDNGLINGVSVDQLRGPVRAEITTDGIDCATDWEGNVADYLHDHKGYGPTINHGPVFHGASQGGQFAGASSAERAPGRHPMPNTVMGLQLHRLVHAVPEVRAVAGCLGCGFVQAE